MNLEVRGPFLWRMFMCGLTLLILMASVSGVQENPTGGFIHAILQLESFGNVGIEFAGGSKARVCASRDHNGRWQDVVATFACKEVGFQHGYIVAPKTFGTLKTMNGKFVKVICEGSKNRLSECNVDTSSFCRAAAAICSHQNISLNDFSVTLSRGFYGWVTVTHYGRPGLICGKEDPVWSKGSATVICRQLGHDTGHPFCCGALGKPNEVGGLPVFTRDGGQRLPIWLQNVTCHGNESHLKECALGTWGGHGGQCDLKDNVGVVCYNTSGGTETNVSDYGIILRVSHSYTRNNYGQVEILHKGVWGSIAMDKFTWTEREASAVCRDKGYQYGLPHHGKPWGFTNYYRPVWLYNVSCMGNATTLLNCSHAGWGAATWKHDGDVGVVCYNNDTPNVVRARIANSTKTIYDNYGRAEIQYKEVWGTICKHGWTDRSANVICRQAGFQYGGLATNALEVGEIPRWITEVNCTGDESYIENCTYRGWGGLDECPPADEAGVFCFNNSVNKEADYEIHLTDGSWDRGSVKLALDERIGHLCVNSTTWTDVHANIVCSKLGFVGGKAIPSNGNKSDDEPYWMQVSTCPANSTSIIDCKEKSMGFGENRICTNHAFVECRSHGMNSTATNPGPGLKDHFGTLNITGCSDCKWSTSVPYPWIIELFYPCLGGSLNVVAEPTTELNLEGPYCSNISVNNTVTVRARHTDPANPPNKMLMSYRKVCKTTGSLQRHVEWNYTGSLTHVTGNDIKRRKTSLLECQLDHENNSNVIQLHYDFVSGTCYVKMYGFSGPHVNLEEKVLATYERLCVGPGVTTVSKSEEICDSSKSTAVTVISSSTQSGSETSKPSRASQTSTTPSTWSISDTSVTSTSTPETSSSTSTSSGSDNPVPLEPDRVYQTATSESVPGSDTPVTSEPSRAAKTPTSHSTGTASDIPSTSTPIASPATTFAPSASDTPVGSKQASDAPTLMTISSDSDKTATSKPAAETTAPASSSCYQDITITSKPATDMFTIRASSTSSSTACHTSTQTHWRSWGPWELCSDMCDGEVITRTRECSVPSKCVGLSNDIAICYQKECEEKLFEDKPEHGEDASGAVIIGSLEIALILAFLLAVAIYDIPAFRRDFRKLRQNLRDMKENMKDWLKIDRNQPPVP